MATPQTDTKSQTIELATTAFDAFCDDISGMFGVDMKCSQKEAGIETVKGFSQKFKKLASVNFIKSEGILNGTFHIVFDQGGLFTLAGTIVMLPKQRILDDRKRGSAKEAEGMTDAIKEAGNLLVGSWDRIFREEMKGHGHFLQSNTYVGNPWDNPKEKIGLSDTEEFSFISYEITIDDYPAFNCGVILPEAIFAEPPAQPAAETPKEEKPADKEPVAEVEKVEKEEKPADKETAQTAPAAEVKKEEKPADKEIVQAALAAEVKSEEKSADETPAKVEAAAGPKSEDIPESAKGKEMPAGPVSETIQKMVQSSSLPDGISLSALKMCAKDIMQKEILWGNADDSVQQAMTKMQQADTGYMMIGKDELPEGIVSTFDLASAVSIYLKPMFAKWRRPTDDATLQIKVKWVMTRPVRTITLDTSLTTIMENMCQSGLRCLPVVEKNGKVIGLVTAFDIFKALLNTTNTNISSAGKTLQTASLA